MKDHRTKVLLVVEKNIDPEFGGGLGTWVIQIRKGLTELGYEVIVAAEGGRDVTAFRHERLPDRVTQLVDLCRSQGVDVVISASSEAARCAAPRLPPGARFMSTVQSTKPSHVRRELRDGDIMDAIVGSSPAVTAEILRHADDRSRVFCVPNGIEIDEGDEPLPLSRRPPVIGVVGRLVVEQKRAHWLPRLFEVVRSTHPDAQMKVVGGGALLGWLQAFERRTPGFEVLGSLSRHEVSGFLREKPRVVLMTTAYEGLSFGMIEAMWSGSSLVISADPRCTGGILDARHAVTVEMGRSGFLPRHTLRRLGDAVSFALSGGAEIHARALRARGLVRGALTDRMMSVGFSEVIETILRRDPVDRREVRVRPYPSRRLEGLLSPLALASERVRLRMATR